MSSDKSPNREEVGERVRLALVALQMTQAEMSRRAGVNQSFISQVCRGASLPSVQLLQELGRCGVSLEWVLLAQGPMRQDESVVPVRTTRAPIIDLAEMALALGGESLSHLEGYMRGFLAAQEQRPQRARAG